MTLGTLSDLAVNLLASPIAFVAGILVSRVYLYARARKGRKFWGRGFSRQETVVFLGSLPTAVEFEPTGSVGSGDMRALQELTALLADVRVKPEVVEVSKLADRQLDSNLILIGGDDNNQITAEVLQRVGCRFELRADPVSIWDTTIGKSRAPQWGAGGPNLPTKTMTTDYGIILRARNPYNPKRIVVAIAGAYGFATWAGVRLLLDQEFLRSAAEMPNLECVYRVDLIREVIAGTTILDVRELPSPQEAKAAWLERESESVAASVVPLVG